MLTCSVQNADDLVVRLRGLPYSATRLDIKELLNDCKIVNADKGVTFTFLEDGRPSGEAFVDLATEDDVTKALEHNNEHMGRRYVEIFRASKGEKEWDLRVSSENKPMGDGGNGGENVVRLRGLPFGVSHNEVVDFFSGLVTVYNYFDSICLVCMYVHACVSQVRVCVLMCCVELD